MFVAAEGEPTTSTFGAESFVNLTDALTASIVLVKEGMCDVLMKGGVDSSTMMKALLHDDAGIKTGRLLSDIFLLEFPQRVVNQFVMITDGGMTLAPDLKNKAN